MDCPFVFVVVGPYDHIKFIVVYNLSNVGDPYIEVYPRRIKRGYVGMAALLGAASVDLLLCLLVHIQELEDEGLIALPV